MEVTAFPVHNLSHGLVELNIFCLQILNIISADLITCDEVTHNR